MSDPNSPNMGAQLIIPSEIYIPGDMFTPREAAPGEQFIPDPMYLPGEEFIPDPMYMPVNISVIPAGITLIFTGIYIGSGMNSSPGRYIGSGMNCSPGAASRGVNISPGM